MSGAALTEVDTTESRPGGAARWRSIVLGSVPVVLAVVVWSPILDNYLWNDDFFTFFRLRDQGTFDYLARPQGGHPYATMALVFWAADLLFGPQPGPLFCLALITHLVNVALLFAVIRRLAGSERLACLGATLWGTSPVLEASLGWFSVYGQVLLATMLFAVVLHLARLAAGARLRPWAPAAWVLLLLLGATSFGIGIGAALVMPLVAWLILPPGGSRRIAVATLIAAAVLIAVLFVASQRYYGAMAVRIPSFLINLLRAMPAILGMTFHLFGYGTVRAVTGTMAWQFPYRSSAAIIIGAGAVAVVLAAFVRGTPTARRHMTAALLLAAASYGIIATGRAPYFGGGSAGGRVDRYHYVGLALLVLTLCIALGALAARLRPRARLRDGLLALAVAVLVVAWARAPYRINHRAFAKEQLDQTLAAIDRSIDAVPPGQAVYISNSEFGAMGGAFIHAKRIFPGWAGAFVIFYPENIVRGRRVYFVEPDPRVRAAMRGRRTADLLVERIPGPPAAQP